jgi:hypothetical protein
MPILWTIDHAERMDVGTVQEPLRQVDVEKYLEGMTRSATSSYVISLDLTRSSLAVGR